MPRLIPKVESNFKAHNQIPPFSTKEINLSVTIKQTNCTAIDWFRTRQMRSELVPIAERGSFYLDDDLLTTHLEISLKCLSEPSFSARDLKSHASEKNHPARNQHFISCHAQMVFVIVCVCV